MASSSADAAAASPVAAKGPSRQGTLLQRAGTQLQQSATNLGTLQRASTLPTEDKELRHGATMPILLDQESVRPWCCGLWKTQQMLGFVFGLVCVFVIEIVQPVREYSTANAMFAITALMACFWVFEVIPIHMTALIPVVAMPLTGITSSELAASSYWDNIQLLVIGTFLVDIALEQVHLPRRLVLLMLLRVGVVQPPMLLAIFMGVPWILSMFCNNIAVTLIITPFAITLMNSAEEQVRDEMASSSASDSDAEGDSEDAADEVQRLGDGILLGIAFASSIGGMATLTGSIPNFIMGGQDLTRPDITWVKWWVYASPLSTVCLIIAYAAIYIRYVRGLSLSLTEDILRQEYEELEKEVGIPREELCCGCFTRDEICVGLIQILQITLLIIRPFAITPFVTTNFGDTLVNDATLAMAPALLLFVLPSVVRPGQSVLTWPEVHEKFDFGLMLLIGGGYAIAFGFKESGLDIALGAGLAGMTSHVHPLLINFTILSVVSLATQMFSAIGTASTVIPMLLATSMDAVYNPLALTLPATMACSFAFVLPTACPPNVVVLAKSQDMPRPLRVRDFFFTGLPINLLACVAGAILLPLMGEAVFGTEDPFSKETCDSIACRYIDIPGWIRGRWVDQQACILQDIGCDSMCCKLFNGTILNLTEDGSSVMVR